MRVLKRGGSFLIVAPNFGAPNRASPGFSGSRFRKLIGGFARDFIPAGDLNWNRVEPIATSNSYEIDWDTTIEPYLGSLLKYLKHKGFSISFSASFWDLDSPKASFMQKNFKFLGRMGIYPFNLWGPHMTVVIEK